MSVQKYPSNTDSILYNIKNKIATITLNRPEKMNALRFQEFETLMRCIQLANNDPSVHVIRLCSSGDRAFSGGLDLNMLQEFSSNPDKIGKLLELGESTVRTFLQSKKPVVAQIQGPAVAWGTILCLIADFVIAGENPKTFFSFNEIDLGIFPSTGALTTALFNFGFRKTKKILMIPEKINLDQAEHLDIITKRVDLKVLDEKTLEFCHILAEKHQNILIPIKALLNNFYWQNLENFFKKERQAMDLVLNENSNQVENFIEDIWT